METTHPVFKDNHLKNLAIEVCKNPLSDNSEMSQFKKGKIKKIFKKISPIKPKKMRKRMPIRKRRPGYQPRTEVINDLAVKEQLNDDVLNTPSIEEAITPVYQPEEQTDMPYIEQEYETEPEYDNESFLGTQEEKSELKRNAIVIVIFLVIVFVLFKISK